MWSSLPIIVTLVASATAQDYLTGGQCCYEGWRHCQDQGAWGCIQIDGGGPNCVDQTPYCDYICESGYAYQKDLSDDTRCVCSGWADASQPLGTC